MKRGSEEIVPSFYFRDLIQVIIGATVLAIPIAFTEEVSAAARNLPMVNVMSIMALSLLFVSIFTYYHYHHVPIKRHTVLFLKRVGYTYLFSFIVVAAILILIEGIQLQSNLLVSFKKIIIVTFPASMSASIADTIR